MEGKNGPGVLVVEDEEIALSGLCEVVREVMPQARVMPFRSPVSARQAFEENPCEIALLDINMGGQNGVDLAKSLKLLSPDVNIIFVTGYSEYTGVAMRIHASGYILKPVTPDKLRAELEDLRHPIEPASPDVLTVRTFGDFEVFYKGSPVNFKYRKTKELLAYLVDRHGALCTVDMIVTVLWEEEDGERKKSYFRNLKQDLQSTLRHIGCGDTIVVRRGAMAVNVNRMECDYFRWLEGDVDGINAYRGEYMSQYSWAEITNGMLSETLYDTALH
ncbi:MAG: response regulator [Lachnospiraceae bacterium]|nr:response regulator [Lachnospiraceae bacterium]